MTDRTTPRVARANPAPRRALPRVTPLGVGGGAPATLPAKGGSAGARPEQEPEATGRDLLIPNGASQRRKGRGSATVPTLAELMPPERPAGAGQGPRQVARRQGQARRCEARRLQARGHQARGAEGQGREGQGGRPPGHAVQGPAQEAQGQGGRDGDGA